MSAAPVLECKSSLSDSLPFWRLIIIFIFCSFWSSAMAAAVRPDTDTHTHQHTQPLGSLSSWRTSSAARCQKPVEHMLLQLTNHSPRLHRTRPHRCCLPLPMMLCGEPQRTYRQCGPAVDVKLSFQRECLTEMFQGVSAVSVASGLMYTH